MACNYEGSDLCAHAEEKLNLARCCDTGNKSTKTKLMAGASDGSYVVERGEHISTREENRVVRLHNLGQIRCYYKLIRRYYIRFERMFEGLNLILIQKICIHLCIFTLALDSLQVSEVRRQWSPTTSTFAPILLRATCAHSFMRKHCACARA